MDHEESDEKHNAISSCPPSTEPSCRPSMIREESQSGSVPTSPDPSKKDTNGKRRSNESMSGEEEAELEDLRRLIQSLRTENLQLEEAVELRDAKIDLLKTELQSLRNDLFTTQQLLVDARRVRDATPDIAVTSSSAPASAPSPNTRGSDCAVSAATSFGQPHSSLHQRRQQAHSDPSLASYFPQNVQHLNCPSNDPCGDADDVMQMSTAPTPKNTSSSNLMQTFQQQTSSNIRGQALSTNTPRTPHENSSRRGGGTPGMLGDDDATAAPLNATNNGQRPTSSNNITPRRQHQEAIIAHLQRQLEVMRGMLPILSVPNFTYSIVQSGKGGKADSTVASYEIMVNYGDDAYALYRRYSEFKKLHEQVQSECKGEAIPVFPGRKGLFGSTNNDKKAIDKRRQELEVFLRQLVASDTIRKSRAVKEFFANLSLETSTGSLARNTP